jgi:putative transposase
LVLDVLLDDRQWSASGGVTHRNDRWHVSFTTPGAKKIAAATGAMVGIDRGVANTLATSEGRMIQAPSLTDGEQTRFIRMQQKLARQEKGSRRREQTLDQLAVLRRRLEDRRTDWVEQTTTDLARTYELVAVEDLQVPNMVRRPKPKPDPETPGAFLPNGARAKAALNKAILASVWGRFLTASNTRCPKGQWSGWTPATPVVRVPPAGTAHPETARAKRSSSAKPADTPRTPTPTPRSTSSTAP